MNGVHCQMRLIMTEASGNLLTQSTCADTERGSTKFTMPNTGSNMVVFHINAPATGVIRNGVMSRVRTTPRPRNTRSRSSANSRPSTTETMHRDHDDDDGVERDLPERAVLEDVDVVAAARRIAASPVERGSTTASSSRA